MGGRRVLGVALVAVVLATAADAAASAWIGDRYAWRYAYARLESTVDGGKHWKPMIDSYTDRRPGTGWVEDWAHMLPRGGFALVGHDDGRYRGTDLYWTVDDGAHWYRAPFDWLPEDPSDFGGNGPPDAYLAMEGHGRYAFFASTSINEDDDGNVSPTADLYQVVPWPPHGAALRCAHGFQRSLIGIRGRVCEEPPTALGTVSVAHLDAALLASPVNIPGGVAVMADSWDPTVVPHRVVIRRFGRTRIVPLPVTDVQAQQLRRSYGYPTLRIDWPVIDAEAQNASTGGMAIWHSRDGGATWTVSWPSE